MPGSNADIATLAADNAFIAAVRAEMIKRAVAILGQTAETIFNVASPPATLTVADVGVVANRIAIARRVLANGASDAPRVAANIAAGNGTVAAAAPAIPSDGSVAYCVNEVWDQI